MSQLAEVMRCRKIHSAPYAHWMLGRVERTHAALNDLLRMTPKGSQNKWPILLPITAMLGLNHTVSSVSKVCPWEVENGHPPSSHLIHDNEAGTVRVTEAAVNLGYGSSDSLRTKEARMLTYITELEQSQRLYTQAVRVMMRQQRLKAARTKNKQASVLPPSFNEGDRVTVYRPKQSQATPQWQTGWTVTRKSSGGYICTSPTGTQANIASGYIKAAALNPADDEKGLLQGAEPDL